MALMPMLPVRRLTASSIPSVYLATMPRFLIMAAWEPKAPKGALLLKPNRHQPSLSSSSYITSNTCGIVVWHGKVSFSSGRLPLFEQVGVFVVETAVLAASISTTSCVATWFEPSYAMHPLLVSSSGSTLAATQLLPNYLIDGPAVNHSRRGRCTSYKLGVCYLL